MYVHVGSAYFTGHDGYVRITGRNTIEFKFVRSTFSKRLHDALYNATKSNPLTQKELDSISLPQQDMLHRSLMLTHAQVIVEDNVVVQASLIKDTNNG